jgi:predicted amidophosphoribosyltransferase
MARTIIGQKWLFAPRCWGCGDSLKRRRDFCGKCRREILAALAHSGCLLRYEGAVKGLLHCLRGAAPHLAAAWFHSLLTRQGQVECWQKLGLTAVALAPQNSRDGERGLLLLGKALAKDLRVPLLQPFEKIGRRSQHGLSLAERMDTACFVRLSPTLAPGGRILLIDDVDTTGTTLDQCAYLLRKAGVEEVVLYSLARQVMPSLERKKAKPEEESHEMNPLLLHLFV